MDAKLNVVICSDLGHHGDKLLVYAKKAGEKSGSLSYVNFPAAVVQNDNSRLNQDIKVGNVETSGCSALYRVSADSTETYSLGGLAITRLDPGKVRKLANVVGEKDRAFLSLGESRFESTYCDALIETTIAFILQGFVNKGVVQKLSDIRVCALGFALPHALIYNTVEKNVNAVNHVTSLLKSRVECEIAFDCNNYKHITFIPLKDAVDGVSDDTIIIDEEHIVAESQCVSLLYQALLNVDGTAKEFTDSDGGVHTLENDGSYFNNSLIVDLGKRTGQVLHLIDLGTFEEISQLEPRDYAMYNVDCRVAAEMNEFYGLKEGGSFYFKGEDIDNILTGKLDCTADKVSGDMIYNMDDEKFNITESRLRNVEAICRQMVDILMGIDDGIFLRRIRFIFVAGGSAKLFYPVINDLIISKFPAKEGRVILCEETYGKDMSDSVFSVCGGLFRMLTAMYPEIK